MSDTITLYIRGPDGTSTAIKLPVDIERELSVFDWNRPIWSADKLLAASPFRYDRLPSFYCYLADSTTAHAGDWGDSGSTSPEWQRGDFVKLLSFLRNETKYDTREYLIAKYGNGEGATEEYAIQLRKLTLPQRNRPLDPRILDEFRFRSPYLGSRGITEAVQRLCDIGFDQRRNAITIPWFLPSGQLANVKYRRVDSKVFWYAKGGLPLRSLVYGLNIIYSRGIKKAIIVEAEVDAMTFMSAGIPAIATGGSTFNEIKRDAIVRSPLEEVVVFRDNDAAGKKWQRAVIAELSPYVRVRIGTVNSRYKDVNEAHGAADIADYVRRARRLLQYSPKLLRLKS